MKREIVFVILIIGLAFCRLADAQTPEITFQGQLQNSSAAASGSFDFEFLLFEAAGGGSQIGSTITRNGVAVTNGIFSVNLDFGAGFPGANRFIEIRVRASGGGAFTTLSPRQPVTSSPYSIKSVTADNAANATNAVNATNATTAITATNFTGSLTGDVTGTQSATTVARLQGRSVTGTAPLDGQVLKYNGAASQWQPDTDITGTGGGGGTITGVTPGTGLTGGGATGNVTLGIANGGVNTPQLADNGVTDAKINTVSGAKVTGTVASAANAANATNATNAASATTAISFSGPLAGDVTGNQSTTTVSKLRDVTLPAPIVTDNGKVLKYKNNGVDPITLEWATDNTSSGGGVTTVTASGPLASSGGATPNISLTGIVPIANGGTGSATKNFVDLTTDQTIGGNKAFSSTLTVFGAVNTATQYNFGGSRVLGVGAVGSGNTFAGLGAGGSNPTGSTNSFFGANAGSLTTTGSDNSFFGRNAGNANTTGSNNTVIGSLADVGATGLTFATAIGAGATVGTINTVVLGRSADTVLVPGELNVTASAGIGTTAPAAKLHVVGASGSAGTPVAIVQSSGSQIPLAFKSGATENARIRADNQGNLVLATLNGTDKDMYFRAGDDSSTDMFIQSSSGNVGIGTTSPGHSLTIGSAAGDTAIGSGAKLGIYGPGQADLIIRDTNIDVEGVFAANAAGVILGSFTNHKVIIRQNNIPRITIDPGGGPVSPFTKFSSFVKLEGTFGGGTGNLCYEDDGPITVVIRLCGSSLRYKTNVRDFTPGLNLLNRLRPVTFNWKKSGKLDFGLIAEEVAEVEPLLATYNDKGEIEGVKYDRVGVVLINAVREQQTQIEGQQKQIADQTKTIKRQQAEIDALRTHICSQSPSAAFCKP